MALFTDKSLAMHNPTDQARQMFPLHGLISPLLLSSLPGLTKSVPDLIGGQPMRTAQRALPWINESSAVVTTREPPLHGVVFPQRENRVTARLSPNPDTRCMGLFRWRRARAPFHGVVPPKKG